jgi:DNA-binding NarL/FixJ family response regulator
MFDGAESPAGPIALDAGKLAKVLALADSEQEGEALAAVRAAGGMLAKAGLSFADLLNAPPSPRCAAVDEYWLRHVALHVVEALQDEVAGYKREAKDLQRRLNRAQRDLARARREAACWKAAAESAGGASAVQGADAPPRRTHAAIRSAIEAYLADPVKTALSDREIARRVGVSNQTVSNHRKRLTNSRAA